MSVFKSEEEVHKYLGEIFVRAIEDPEIGAKLEKAGLRMRVDYTDPTTVLFVDMAAGKVLTDPEADDQEWDVALAMTADDGHRFWLGKLNFTVAMTKGSLRTKGPVTELLKLLPLAKPLFATYEEILRKDGREDLIEAAQ